LPPQTEGIKIVEQLIQLGERCHWMESKGEVHWMYGRALAEELLFTLLAVEPFFDLPTLEAVFASGFPEAPTGSKLMLSKIESMVLDMQQEALGNPDAKEREYQFDPAEILGTQFQSKFCASVKVTISPFNRTTTSAAHAHMAQHFREVSLVLSQVVDC
jgi:hypothetical protein